MVSLLQRTRQGNPTALRGVTDGAPVVSRTRGRLAHLAISIVMVVALAAPLAAHLAGVQADAIENRALTESPSADQVLALDEAAVARLLAVLTERFPARAAGVSVDAWIDRHVFGDSPNPDVVLGRGGWLFLREEALPGCLTRTDLDAIVTELASLHRAVTASGRTFRFTVAPSKAAIEHDMLPPHVLHDGCARRNHEAIGELLARRIDLGTVPFWADVTRLREATGRAFFAYDTHWKDAAPATLAAAVIRSLRPDLWDPSALVRLAPADKVGDLSLLIGLPATEPERRAVVRRPDVTVRLEASAEWDRSRRFSGRATGGSAALLPEPTLLFHDSFGDVLVAQLPPYFADLTFVHNDSLRLSGIQPTLARGRIIAIEVAERLVHRNLVERRLAARFAAALAADLRHRDVRPAEPSQPLQLQLEGARYLVLRRTEEMPPERELVLTARIVAGDWVEIDRVGEERGRDAPVFDLGPLGPEPGLVSLRVTSGDGTPVAVPFARLVALEPRAGEPLRGAGDR